jgi:hypothetical protein
MSGCVRMHFANAICRWLVARERSVLRHNICQTYWVRFVELERDTKSTFFMSLARLSTEPHPGSSAILIDRLLRLSRWRQSPDLPSRDGDTERSEQPVGTGYWLRSANFGSCYASYFFRVSRLAFLRRTPRSAAVLVNELDPGLLPIRERSTAILLCVLV